MQIKLLSVMARKYSSKSSSGIMGSKTYLWCGIIVVLPPGSTLVVWLPLVNLK